MQVHLKQLRVRPVDKSEEARYRELMRQHHYLGDLPKIGHTLWYVATIGDEWTALLSFSASAWKCGARDRWIGWDFRRQYDRLSLIVNNSRFLILPDWHIPNLGSKALSLCQRRLDADWRRHFGHPLLLLETFVDPARFQGTVYRAANWTCVGQTMGFRRTSGGYGAAHGSPKLVFVRPLREDAKAQLARPVLRAIYRVGPPKLFLNAAQMRALPTFFTNIPDPRRAQGRIHRLPVVLAIAAAAILCGMRGYKAIALWADGLNAQGRERFGCRRDNRVYRVPSESSIRDVLIRVDPVALELALREWNAAFGEEDESLAIDADSMCRVTGDPVPLLAVAESAA